MYEEIRRMEKEEEKKMTTAHRIRKTAMEVLGFGGRSYQSLSDKEQERVDKECRRIAADILSDDESTE